MHHMPMKPKTWSQQKVNETKKTKIGLYGGSFDPIHYGHLNLAVELMEHCKLDEVWFIPAKQNPHKNSEQTISAEHRLRMCELALELIPQFSVHRNELCREGVSYTIDTVLELMATHCKGIEHTPQFYLLLGADAIATFTKWHRVIDLVELIPVLIGDRGDLPNNWESNFAFEDQAIIDAIKSGLVKTRQMEISSTDIRERIAGKKYCGHLVPEKALDYIYANGLYYAV